MLAFFNPVAMQQMTLTATQEWMNGAMVFSQTLLNAQSDAIVTIQEAYLKALQPTQTPPQYLAVGKICYPDAFFKMEAHA